ncbi:MAG: sulfite exporter TauE/SafE family protein, partial [Armatimonadetes bacterium]|nr:sulfite exporter TauE/SafE family protein [Armatimonadota bacterium]
RGLASPRLAVPFALFSSLGGAIGASLGLAAPRAVIETLLGVTVLGVALLMCRLGTSSTEREGGPIALALGMVGGYVEPDGQHVAWQAHYARYGLPIAFVIGLAGGLFGVGGGWAMVPTFTALMGVPLKVAAASSVLVIALGNTGALTVYLRSGSILPLMVVPSVLGLMLGARIGARRLAVANAALVRRTLVAVLMLAGARSLLVGLLGLLR